MEDGVVQIITTCVSVCIPALVTLVSTLSIRKQANKHSARQSILQLIFEDKVRALEGSQPENYQAILDEYDEYIKNGGNSYIKEKVKEYIEWRERTNKKLTKAK